MSSTAASGADASSSPSPRRGEGGGEGIALVATAALFWSLGGLLARLVDTDTWTTVFWRSIFAAIFLLGVTFVQEGRAAWRRTIWGMGWPGVAMALCFAAASTCFINALARTTVANTLIIQSTSPFIAALLGWLWMGERVRRRSWVAMAVALTGAVVMASHSWGAGSISGDLLALITAFAFAAATVIVRRQREIRMTAAAGLAGVFSAAFAWWPARPLDVGVDDLALLALFGAVQLGFGLILFTAGARMIPVAEAALIAVLESALGPVWVWLALGETPAAAALLGGAVILAALIIHIALDLREGQRVLARAKA